MDVVLRYLGLDEQYCRHLGGLRWSETEDVLEYEDGRTFAFNKEIATFLQGFGSVRPLIHFGHILHLLDLLHGRQAPAEHLVGRLAQAFRDSGMPVRNAGVLCALLCRDLPLYPGNIDAGQIANRLCNTAWPIRNMLARYHKQFRPVDVPPLDPNAFESEIWGALWGHTNDELRSWLRHGHLPLQDAGEKVARQMPPPEPRTLTGILEQLMQRPRLAGVQPFVPQMLSALTLPPRRLAREEIPVGGYADVATHGQVEQILPSQFALDDLEFVRRYAERELLYFRREEPNQRTKQELVVVLDQGVRLWGEVRLVLSAAVMALARQAERRRLPFLLAVTSLPGEWLDPLQVNEETLADALEASDLSAHPGLLLEAVLEKQCSGSRDIVLLTHPRSLNEENVRTAMKRLPPESRLFALTVDRAGTAVFDEIKRGVPCEIRRFQVDLKLLDRQLPSQDTNLFGYPKPWSGDIEPIGFPFRFGPGDPLPPHRFQFDAAGDWLLAAGRNGMLYAWKTDGSDMEILPAAWWIRLC